jgi:hypothetical protein
VEQVLETKGWPVEGFTGSVGSLSGSADSFQPMTYIPLTDPQRRHPAALTGSPRQVENLDGREGLDELHRWGWVFGGEKAGLGPCEAYR